MTTFAPHQALELITSGKLTFDARVALQRVVSFAPKPKEVLAK